jgi:hypothetical protein
LQVFRGFLFPPPAFLFFNIIYRKSAIPFLPHHTPIETTEKLYLSSSRPPSPPIESDILLLGTSHRRRWSQWSELMASWPPSLDFTKPLPQHSIFTTIGNNILHFFQFSYSLIFYFPYTQFLTLWPLWGLFGFGMLYSCRVLLIICLMKCFHDHKLFIWFKLNIFLLPTMNCSKVVREFGNIFINRQLKHFCANIIW